MAIQSLNHWRHVDTYFNLADLLSRGMEARALIDNQLWWHGLPWLLLGPAHWPTKLIQLNSTLPKVQVTCLAIHIVQSPKPLWKRYSSFNHLTRIVAWLFRFCNSACKFAVTIKDDVVTTAETRKSRIRTLRLSQEEELSDVLDVYKQKKSFPKDITWPNCCSQWTTMASF